MRPSDADIHKFILDTYTEEDFVDLFCPHHFPHATGTFAKSDSYLIKIQKLIQFCFNCDTLDDLLAALAKERPQAYAKGLGAHTAGDSPGNAPLPALHQLPQPPRDFTGRAEELTELVADVKMSGVTISGMDGIGKTTLALVLANKLAPNYPDAQFYLDLRGASPAPLTPAEVMTHIVRSYDTNAILPEEDEALQSFYNSELLGQRALLVLDNAADGAQVAGLLPPPGCLLILTSRRHFTLPGLYSKDLDTLPPADAHALLLRIAPRIKDHTEEIARLCGYLPQALRLAASALAERIDLSPAAYIRKLADATQHLKLTGVDASFTLSYDLLSPELQVQWRQLAVFPGDFDTAAAAAVWECESDAAHEALSELLRYSLVEYREVTGSEQGRYGLHDLAQKFADSQLGKDERFRAQHRHAAHYLSVLRAADELYMQGGDNMLRGVALYDTEQRNFKYGQAWAAAHMQDGDECAQLCSDYPDASPYVLSLHQDMRERIQWRLAALDVARQRHDRGAESAHLGNLGDAYSDLAETLTAIEYYELHLVIVREIGDRRSEGKALGNLGSAYADLRDARKTIEFYEQHLVIAREIGDRAGERSALSNLGSAYNILGDARKAVEYHEQALVIAREIGDRSGERAALGYLGSVYAAMGDARKAIEFREQNLVLARKAGNRRYEGNVLGKLGNAYIALGDARKAIEIYEQSLVIKREIGDRRGEGNVLNDQGLAYAALGDAHKAMEFYERALAIADEVGDWCGKALSSWNLGDEYEKLGDLDRAVALMQVRVDYERDRNYPDKKNRAEYVEAIRARAKGVG